MTRKKGNQHESQKYWVFNEAAVCIHVMNHVRIMECAFHNCYEKKMWTVSNHPYKWEHLNVIFRNCACEMFEHIQLHVCVCVCSFNYNVEIFSAVKQTSSHFVFETRCILSDLVAKLNCSHSFHVYYGFGLNEFAFLLNASSECDPNIPRNLFLMLSNRNAANFFPSPLQTYLTSNCIKLA